MFEDFLITLDKFGYILNFIEVAVIFSGLMIKASIQDGNDDGGDVGDGDGAGDSDGDGAGDSDGDDVEQGW